MRLESLTSSKSAQSQAGLECIIDPLLGLESLPRHTKIGLELTAKGGNANNMKALAPVDENVQSLVWMMAKLAADLVSGRRKQTSSPDQPRDGQ